MKLPVNEAALCGSEINYFRYWAKSKTSPNQSDLYHCLPFHNLDVAAVGHSLLLANPKFIQRFAALLAIPEELLLEWITFSLANHDDGKYATSFQQLNSNLYELLHPPDKPRPYSCRHDSLGYLIWKELASSVLTELLYQSESDGAVTRQIREIFEIWGQSFFGHHGKPPSIHSDIGPSRYDVRDFCTERDLSACQQYIEGTRHLCFPHSYKLAPYLNSDFRRSLKEISWWLAGFAVLSDWIGSNSNFFSFMTGDDSLSLEEYWSSIALPAAERAIAESGVLPTSAKVFGGIRELFDYVKDPTPLQFLSSDRAMSDGPQLWILEDVPGSGKTEAALILAHRLMSENRADGIFIALPTMATANAMYERMASCYRALYTNPKNASLILTHGARHLVSSFQKSILPNIPSEDPYSPNDPSTAAQCAAWLGEHQKKALLADVGIGTIDQALMGILPVRHQSLRLFGLFRKVLIVDEVHAYDSYMLTLLQALLRFHARVGGSVILLSATLPTTIRRTLLKSFAEGAHFQDDSVESLNQRDYPLFTQYSRDGLTEIAGATRSEVARTLPVKFFHSDEEAYRIILECFESGRCGCWIRNTVADAYEAYSKLAQRIPSNQLLLFHSRFALSDRLLIESEVLRTFGKQSGASIRTGKILIATQVVEQSLDLDFDDLISDLAPIDLLIQRAGRQHRHRRILSGDLAIDGTDQRRPPVFHILSPAPVSEPDQDWYSSMFPKAAFVYPHVGNLWRTARLLIEAGAIEMPSGARNLIEGVYGPHAEAVPNALHNASNVAEGEERGKGSMGSFNGLDLKQGYSTKQGWNEEQSIPTRIGPPTIQLYLARWQDGELSPWATGDFPWDLSSVKIYESQIQEAVLTTAMRKAVERLQTEDPFFTSPRHVLPLSKSGADAWLGSIRGKDGAERLVRYDCRRGVRLEEEWVEI